MDSTRNYAEFTAGVAWRARIRGRLRDAAIRCLAWGRKIEGAGWIQFPYYHHVFDDERAGFARQIGFLRKHGDFISLDSAVDMISSGQPIRGRYFCVTFDDGLKSCVTGALPILKELGVPATFFVVTDLVGRSLSPTDLLARDVFGFRGTSTTLDFMTWDDCRTLVAQGMTIGSHSCSHRKLVELDAAEVGAELGNSRSRIELELARPCLHFCPPYGIPGTHFDGLREAELAKRAGYRSLATGLRGKSRAGSNPFGLHRDHLLAQWENDQLRYFFSGA